MALSARIPSGFDTNKFIPETFSKDVLVAVKNKLVAVPVFNNKYPDGLVKGDTLYVTRTNTVSATEVTVGTEGVQKNPYNTTAITLTIDKWYEAPVTLDEMSLMQSHIDVETYARKESVYALNKEIDSSVCALFSALNGSSVAGSDGSAWTDDVIIAAVEKLDENDAPDDDRAFIADPSTKADLLKIDKFVRKDYVREGVVASGSFGEIYGAPVFITNNLTAATTGSYGVYAHKEAIGIRIAQNLKAYMDDQLATKSQIVINTKALWGVVELRDTFGYPIYTRLA